ncbi:MAG: hypothetical protein RMJ31_00360 [Nitrososphaerota archaeon]|nr:hypothetical protein [Nitrososphaerales archaeon]MDW8044217.1 hypothetical protein [Nitrososphaerota archaeon]
MKGNKKGISILLSASILVALTLVIGVALLALIGSVPTIEKPIQFLMNGKVSNNQIILTHIGGDSVNLGSIVIKTYIPAGIYAGAVYEIPISDLQSYAKINGGAVYESWSWKSWGVGDTLTIPIDRSFARSPFGLMAPKPGEKFVVEVYYRGQVISSCTITMN